MIRLHLVRHGQCEAPGGGRMLGQRDAPLTAIGVGQAAATAARLREVAFVAAFTSDLRRARDTAAIVLGERPLSLRVEPRLREFDIGAWQGLTWDEVEARYPGSTASFTAPRPGLAFPEGESLAGVGRRVGEVLREVRSETAAGDVLVVGHQGALTVLLALALGLPEWGWSRFALGPASVTTIEFHDDAPLLIGLNDDRHLAEAGDGAR